MPSGVGVPGRRRGSRAAQPPSRGSSRVCKAKSKLAPCRALAVRGGCWRACATSCTNGSRRSGRMGRPLVAACRRWRKSSGAGKAARRAAWAAALGRKRAGLSMWRMSPRCTKGASRRSARSAAASAPSAVAAGAMTRKRRSGAPASPRRRSSSFCSASGAGLRPDSPRAQSAAPWLMTMSSAAAAQAAAGQRSACMARRSAAMRAPSQAMLPGGTGAAGSAGST